MMEIKLEKGILLPEKEIGKTLMRAALRSRLNLRKRKAQTKKIMKGAILDIGNYGRSHFRNMGRGCGIAISKILYK